MSPGAVVDFEKERAPRPCDEHWQTFTGLNPDSVFLLSEETKNEECGYCQIERLSKSGGNEFERCTKCKDGVIVQWTRSIQHDSYFGHMEQATIITPTIAIHTRGCSHRIDDGKYIEGKK